VNLKRSLWLCAALVGVSCIAAGAANEAPAITAFDKAFAGINDYTCVLHVHEAKGTATQDRVYQYEFMKPHFVKTLILDGDGKGSGGVSLRGVTIPDGLLQRIVDNYATIPGKLTQLDGGKVQGVETDRIELKVADPASNYGVSDQILYLSKETHWPVRQILYSGSQIVLDENVTELKTNVGLTQSDFPF
jgi:outer membrane lipoprotein-sorting protein